MKGKRFAAHVRGACATRASHASRVPCKPELDRTARRRAQRRAQCERTAEQHVANTRSCFRTCDGPINGQYRSIFRCGGLQCANSGFVTVKKGREGSPCRLRRRQFTPTFTSHARAPSDFLASAFCCAPRIASLRSQRSKKRRQQKQLDARASAWNGNRALSMRPPQPPRPAGICTSNPPNQCGGRRSHREPNRQPAPASRTVDAVGSQRTPQAK